MKILFITHYSALYGANLSMLGLISDLKTRYDCEITVLVPSVGELTDSLSKSGIRYIVTSYYQWELPTIKKITQQVKCIIKKLLNIVLFYKAYKQIPCDFDLIHSNSSVIHIGDYLSKKLRIPHIWHLREYGKEDYNLEYTQIGL